jgi:hypothetical protein
LSLVQENPLWGLRWAIGIPSAMAEDRRGRVAEEEEEEEEPASSQRKGSAPAVALPTELPPHPHPAAAQHQTWASFGKVQGDGGKRRSHRWDKTNGSMAVPLQPAHTPVSHGYLGGQAKRRTGFLRGQGFLRSNLSKSQGLHLLVHLSVCHQANLVRKASLL